MYHIQPLMIEATKKEELLYILDRLSLEKRTITDAEYSRAIDLILGEEYYVEDSSEYEY